MIDSGNTLIEDNWFLQNGGATEVYLNNSSKSTITLINNVFAASPGAIPVWAQLRGNQVLQSSWNTFYSDYNPKGAAIVAVWSNLLTIDQWNKKTAKDGNDILRAWPPPATPY